MGRRVSLFLGLFGAMFIGLVIELYAQSNTGARLAKLSDEKATISKMDLILLNTKVAVLQQMLKDDLSLPFVPTSISYDADRQKIRTSVYVDPAFLAKTNTTQLIPAQRAFASLQHLRRGISAMWFPFSLCLPKSPSGSSGFSPKLP